MIHRFTHTLYYMILILWLCCSYVYKCTRQDNVQKLKDRITPHVNFFQRIVKEELKCKRERSGRSEMEIELGMSVDVCVFVCMCMYVWCGLSVCVSELCVCASCVCVRWVSCVVLMLCVSVYVCV